MVTIAGQPTYAPYWSHYFFVSLCCCYIMITPKKIMHHSGPYELRSFPSIICWNSPQFRLNQSLRGNPDPGLQNPPVVPGPGPGFKENLEFCAARKRLWLPEFPQFRLSPSSHGNPDPGLRNPPVVPGPGPGFNKNLEFCAVRKRSREPLPTQ